MQKANARVPETYQKQLLKEKMKVNQATKCATEQLEEFWESRKSTKCKELLSVCCTRHTKVLKCLEDADVLDKCVTRPQFMNIMGKKEHYQLPIHKVNFKSGWHMFWRIVKGLGFQWKKMKQKETVFI